jgi:hypothetical protein
MVDNIHNDALQYLPSHLHTESEARLEKYVSCAFEPGPFFKDLAAHLRTNHTHLVSLLKQLPVEQIQP